MTILPALLFSDACRRLDTRQTLGPLTPSQHRRASYTLNPVVTTGSQEET
jgi:hypothetical protein